MSDTPLDLARRLVERLREDWNRLTSPSKATICTFATLDRTQKALAAAEQLVRELEG